MDINRIIEAYHDTKIVRTRMEKEEDDMRSYIEEYMLDRGLDQISTGNIKCTLKEISKETVSKVCLPPDIWRRYKRTTHYNMITTKEVRRR